MSRASLGRAASEVTVRSHHMIRLLGEPDALSLRALRLRALRDKPDSFRSSYEAEAAEPEGTTAERLRQSANAADSGVLGAFDGRALVGMLGIVRESRRKVAHCAHLWGVYVVAEARNRGFGGALLHSAIGRLRAAGVEQVHLTVAMTADSARRLYLRAGFEVIGTVREAMKDGDRYVDEELMVLRLKDMPCAGAEGVTSV